MMLHTSFAALAAFAVLTTLGAFALIYASAALTQAVVNKN
ncbi:hypothetical protein J2T37_001953 [Neisseria perflava]|nr:hypothetical protein [Neisseria perflava]MCP1772992.1 hypothetical protein [Neisseria perflava]